MNNWIRQLVMAGLFAALWAVIVTTNSEAALIASDDFESYTAVVGDPDPHFGGSGENGGAGSWTSAWALGEDLVNAMHVRSNLLPGFGNGLEISNLGNPSDSNIITRQFQAQTDDFYVGLTFRTTIDSEGLDDHLLFYVSNSTNDDSNVGYGAGTRRGADVAGPFNTRIATTNDDTSIVQVYGQTYNLVFKVTKSGIATDPFDGVQMWIDQPTEGTPDKSQSLAGPLADLSTFHVWFDPRGSSSLGLAHLAIDNLVIATTYDEAVPPSIIPEPSSGLLLLLGIVAAGAWNRMRIAKN